MACSRQELAQQGFIMDHLLLMSLEQTHAESWVTQDAKQGPGCRLRWQASEGQQAEGHQELQGLTDGADAR